MLICNGLLSTALSAWFLVAAYEEVVGEGEIYVSLLINSKVKNEGVHYG